MSVKEVYHIPIDLLAPIEEAKNAVHKEYVDTHATNKANPHGVTAAQAGAYTKAEADSKIATAVSTKADTTALTAHTGDKANPHAVTAAQAGAYTKAEADSKIATAVAAKADATHTHTIAQVTNLQSSLDAKAATASPTFTGTPKGPTAVAGTNTTQFATTAFVTTAVNAAGAGSAKVFAGSITANGTAKEWTLTHGLGTTNIFVQAFDGSGNPVVFGVTKPSATTVKLSAAVAPANGSVFSVLVMGAGA